MRTIITTLAIVAVVLGMTAFADAAYVVRIKPVYISCGTNGAGTNLGTTYSPSSPVSKVGANWVNYRFHLYVSVQDTANPNNDLSAGVDLGAVQFDIAKGAGIGGAAIAGGGQGSSSFSGLQSLVGKVDVAGEESTTTYPIWTYGKPVGENWLAQVAYTAPSGSNGFVAYDRQLGERIRPLTGSTNVEYAVAGGYWTPPASGNFAGPSVNALSQTIDGINYTLLGGFSVTWDGTGGATLQTMATPAASSFLSIWDANGSGTDTSMASISKTNSSFIGDTVTFGIPEPASLMLLGVGGLALLARPRRKA